MTHKFAEIAFTDAVKDIQQSQGSRKAYEKMEVRSDSNNILSETESSFIAERDSFYMSSVSETGWPYLQHRGGPAGFMKVLDTRTLGFADFSGNRQYVSTGNFVNNNRVALFFMDYLNKRRLKLLGRVQVIGTEESATLDKLTPVDYSAQIERSFLIKVEAFDWNCPKYITPRYTQSQVEELIASLVEEIDTLKNNQPSN
jgi:predicted pyridoxine 5'-phosphate oxidase superfamily flavin-nucleotide-binding protein